MSRKFQYLLHYRFNGGRKWEKMSTGMYTQRKSNSWRRGVELDVSQMQIVGWMPALAVFQIVRATRFAIRIIAAHSTYSLKRNCIPLPRATSIFHIVRLDGCRDNLLHR